MDEAGRGFLALAGELVREILGALMAGNGAIGQVLGVLHHRPGGIGDDIAAAQMVGVIEEGLASSGGTFNGSDALIASEDVFGCLAGGILLNYFAEEGGGAGGGGGFDPAAIAVVHKLRGGIAGQRRTKRTRGADVHSGWEKRGETGEVEAG